MAASKAYVDGLHDGRNWDLDGFDSWEEVERATNGWDDATLNAVGVTVCAEAWGIDLDDPAAWRDACVDYNRGAHEGACDRTASGRRLPGSEVQS